MPGSGRGSLSPRCELIIQMGCPGSGDWRPALARRAISPAAHVTAALVLFAVHTSSSASSFFSPPPPPAPVPLASRRLWAARHCQLRPPPGSPRARRRRAAAAGGRRSLHSGSALGLLPSWAPSSRASPLPPISNYRLRPAEGERGSEAQGEGAREREGGDRAWADFFFKRVGVGVIAGRLLWLLNFKLPCTRLPVCWEQ